MKTKHKNPIAAVYMLTNIIDKKIYIGETSDLLNRISTHRCTPRRKEKYINTPIEKAIASYGFDAFAVSILADSRDNPNIVNMEYRRKYEHRMIEKYHSTDPTIGYNVQLINRTNFYTQEKRSVYGIKATTETKMKLSKMILAYDLSDKSVMLYFGAQSYADIHGISDRSLVTSAIKHGKKLHGVLFYKLDFDSRLHDAEKTIVRKLTAKSQAKHVKSALKDYIQGLEAVNVWCIKFGFPVIDICSLHKEITTKLDSWTISSP